MKKLEPWLIKLQDFRLKRIYLCQRDGNMCKICGVQMVKSDGGGKLQDNVMTVDHIIPTHTGGTNDISNLQLVCNKCNQKKNSEIPEEYLLMKKEKTTKKAVKRKVKLIKTPKITSISFTFLIKIGRK